jgi:GT2 family glycosyltransferase
VFFNIHIYFLERPIEWGVYHFFFFLMPTLIAIAVFNGHNAVERCLSALASAATQATHRVLIVNDGSTDERIAPLLDGFAQERAKNGVENVQVRHNAENRGFTWNVNQAISALRPGEHLLLLNSDTLVTDGWLDQMLAIAESDVRIGTVTPFSNNATICSLPDFSREWPVPHASERARIAQALAANPVAAIDIPTAIGFCMLITRACLAAVGKFDVENFPRGYGEENDFCRRADAKGFRNVLCPNAYVGHIGGQSFSAEKTELMRIGGEKLLTKYPDYNAIVAEWIGRDPAKARREDIARGFKAI